MLITYLLYCHRILMTTFDEMSTSNLWLCIHTPRKMYGISIHNFGIKNDSKPMRHFYSAMFTPENFDHPRKVWFRVSKFPVLGIADKNGEFRFIFTPTISNQSSASVYLSTDSSLGLKWPLPADSLGGYNFEQGTRVFSY